MPKVPLEFAPGSFPAFDEAVLDGKLVAQFYDGYEDDTGVKYKRPGLTAFSTSAIETPVQGVFWSEFLGCFIAVGNGKLYKVTTAGVVSAITGATTDNHNPARFTENGTVVYVTTGQKMLTTNGTTAAEVADVAAPTATTHLAWIDGHILTNQANSMFFWWADVATGEWNENNSESVNANIDKLVALDAGWRELLLFGTRSTEIWYNTGETPGTFQRMEGAYIERGCSAPYSVIMADNTWFWLDHERAFIRLDGRNPKVVSQPVNTLLRDLPDVSDLITSHFQYQNRRFLLLSSRSNNFTLVYDYPKDAWYQWGVWNDEMAQYDRWPVYSATFSTVSSGYVLLGDDGYLYTLSGEASDARFCLRSSHISHQTYDWKLCLGLQVRLKRGYVTDLTSPAFRVRWRDQNGQWGNWHSLPLGNMGEYNTVSELFRCGRYRTRQYEFVQTDTAPFAFVGAVEDIEGIDV